MIPIKVDIKKAETYYEILELLNFKRIKTVKDRLQKLPEKLMPYKKFLSKNLQEYLLTPEGIKKLIIAQPDEQRKIAEEFNKKIYQKALECKKNKENKKNKKNTECNDEDKIFNIINKFFVNNGYYKLDKYGFVSFTGVGVCPYCNRAFVYEPMTEEEQNQADTIKKIKGQIDHFFPKSKYPVLALSYFNLIPSCGVCNYIKREQDPLEIPDLKSPYEIESDEFEFTLGIENTDIFSYRLDKIVNGLIVRLKAPEGNNKVFALEDIYNNHKDIAAEVLLKAKHYNKAYRKSISSTLKNLKLTEADIYRLVFWAYKDTPGKRPLSKFISDIARKIIDNS